MKKLEENQLQYIQETLGELRITHQQIELVRKYMEEVLWTEEQLKLVMKFLVGEVGEEIFSKLPIQDLSKSSIQGIGTELFRKLPAKIAEKVFQVLYVIGGSSCGGMFSFEELVRLKKEKGIGINAEQIVVFAAEHITQKYYFYVNYNHLDARKWIESLIQVIEKDTDVILKSLEKYRGTSSGKVFLWTIYFLLKYPDMELGKEPVILEVDQVYQKQYEDSMLDCLGDIIKPKLKKEKWEVLAERFREPDFSKEAITIIGKMEVDFLPLRWNSALIFINCALSKCLRNIVAFWFYKDGGKGWKNGWELFENLDFRRDLELRKEFFVSWFGINPKKYIALAARVVGNFYIEKQTIQSWKNTLCALFPKYSNLFSDYCFEFFTQNLGNQVWEKRGIWENILVLYEVMKEMDTAFLEQHLQRIQPIQKEKMIAWLVAEEKEARVLRGYFEEESGWEAVFFIREQLKLHTMAEFVIERVLKEYYRLYKDSEFYYRCLIYVILCQQYQKLYFFWSDLEERVKQTFRILDLEGIDLGFQVKVMLQWREGLNKEERESFEYAVKPIFLQYLKERRKETIAAFSGTEIYGRYLFLLLLEEVEKVKDTKESEENQTLIFGFVQDMAGVVRDKVVEILSQRRDWEEAVKKLLLSKRVTEREVAVRVMEVWGKKDYKEELEVALEKEKNAKLKARLEELLCAENGELELIELEGNSKELLLENMVRQLHKKDTKQSLQWAYQTPFSAVRRKDGKLASEYELQAILLAYSFMETCGINTEVSDLVAVLEEDSFAIYIRELFEKWLQGGAEAKKRWVLFVMAIYGGADVVDQYFGLIQDWAKQGRGALAAEAVKALALHPTSQALFLIDDIARKFKHKQVKAAAVLALELAAQQRGITKEELEDQIVPNLGFQRDGKQIVDYGERTFTVRISTAFELEVFDENGKKLKNLPAPSKKDHAEKAALAYEAFKQLKKQIKSVISSQKLRLEQVFLSGRKWKVSTWKELFLGNPLMVSFATELVWGLYQDGILVQSFRYMEDGSFNTEKEEVFVLPEIKTGMESGTETKRMMIGLVHPMELSKEEKTAWQEQMEDYEIVQPIEQLNRMIFTLSEEEIGSNSLERFAGFYMGNAQLGRKILSLGWERGTVWDAGMIYNYYREDLEAGWGVELYFSGGYVGGWDMEEEVTLYDARFYRMGEESEENYAYYGKVEEGKGALLSEVPKQYFSEVVKQLSLVTLSCEKRVENWREKRSY